ncbi:MAG: VPLPA-CTERM sorting domain-containing protein [Devosia sp.]
MRLRVVLGVLAFALAATGAALPAQSATITNGSFESGLSGWTAKKATSLQTLAASAAGSPTTKGVIIPTQGSSAFVTSFDGLGGAVTTLSQAIGVIKATDVLAFDYRLGWDLTKGTQDRAFDVTITPVGGGPAVSLFQILAKAGTNTLGKTNFDSGALTGQISLAALAGLDAILTFNWRVPQAFKGWGVAQLDNVRIFTAVVPLPAGWLLLGTAVAGLGYLGRKAKRKAS